MPISLTLSKRGGKEKLNNSVGSSAISTDNTQMDNNTVSSQDASKDWAQDSIDFPKIETSAEDSSNPDSSMKSIIGRSSAKQPLDPDSSSLGPIESAKEAKEKDKNKSWVKTIGMRTLRLRKNNAESSKSKAHSSSSHSIFSSTQSPSHSEGSSTSAGVKQSTEQVGMGSETGASNSSTTVPGSTQLSLADTGTGTGTSKLKFGKSKKSSNSTVNTSTSSNGIALREMLSSITHPNTTSPSSPSSVTSSVDQNATRKQATATGAGAGTGAGQSGTNQETEGTNDKQDPARFAGDGMSFKAKLIGVLEVSGPRGDRICQEALSELKMAVKAAGEHKQKITVHIALDGLRIRDEKTGDCLYHHQVHKISFIAQDLTDARAFGYIFGSPDMGHRFFGIKTEKSASQVVIAMRDLFQVVFDLKKKEIERAKQQLEMQQKFLATRAAETSAPKTDHKSSIAETYIEGACALGSSSLSSPGISNVGGGGHTSASACASNTVPEVDLLNLEVELNSLQEGLDNIHNNLADSVPFRGSTASISSDPMNAMSSSTNNTNTPNATNAKFSILSHGGHGITAGNANSNFTTTSGDPFGDSFDPFDSGVSSMGFSSGATSSNHQLQQHRQNSSMTSPSPVAFGGSDPFAQIDPFPQPTFSNLESSDSFFNSDPFDTSCPGGSGPSSGTGGNLGSSNSNTNFSFNFGGDGIPSEPQQHHNTSVSSEREMRISQRNSSSSAIGNSHANVNSSSSVGVNSSGGANRSQNSNEFQLGWQASFDDNFVHDMNGRNANDSKGESLDVFTELDPLGTGRVRPFVDRKDFFQDLKNPPRRVLKDLYSTEGGSAVQFSSGEDYPQPQQPLQPSQQQPPPPQQQQHPMQSLLTAPGSNNKVQANTTTSDTINSIPNSFSTHFNPPTSKPKTTGIHDSNAMTGPATALPGFDSAFKTALHASSMSSVRNQTLANQSSQAVTRTTREFTASRSSRIKASHFRSDSPPNYSPPPPPPSAATDTNISFTNNEYFARPATNTITNMTASATPPPLLPPPSSSSLSLSSKDSASGIATSRISPRTAKKSPHLLKQMTISNPTNMNTTTSNSSSPKTLPRSARLGKQFTVDVPSSDENSPIPNLTPPPRPPHGHGHGLGGTLGRNSHITLSTAVPRPYSGSAGTSASSGMASALSSNRGRYGPTTMTSNQGPEPPPRPLQTTMISSINVTPTATPSISSVASQQQQQQQSLATSQLQVNSQEKSGKLLQMSLVSPPPLPPKKTTIGPTLSNPIILSGSNKNLYTRESRDVSSKSSEINDLPLPLPSRKNPQQQYQQWNQPGNFNFNSINSFETGGGGSRYCVPPMQQKKNPDEDNNTLAIKSSPSAPSSTVIPRSRKSSNQSNHSNSNYGYTSDLDNPKPQLEIGPKLAKLTMEQALQQVASVSLGQLAVKLNLPVDKLSNFTIHQLAEKLTMMEMPSATASLGSSPNPNNQRLEIQNQILSSSTTSLRSQFTPSNNFAAAFESNFTAGEFEDDFSTMSAPGGFTSNANVKTNANSRHKTGTSDEDGSKNYDKYAAFRELTVEDASGFSLSSSGVKNQSKGIIGTARPRPRTSKSRSRSGSRSRSSDDDDDDEDDPSQSTKTLNAPGVDQHLIMIMDGVTDIAGIDSRDSSSERTLQVEGVDSGGGMLSYHGSIGGNLDLDISQANNTNTMDDVTDGNLSDDQDQDQDQFYNDMGAKCEFPDDEVASFASNLSGGCGNENSWATFESNFDDHFNVPSKPKVISTTMAPTTTSTVLPRPPIKLQSLKNKNRESPWDSDDDGGGSMMSDNTFKLEANNLTGAKGSAAPMPINSLIFDDKLLECVLPPDPEEFNFQPFEKPSPIITVSARRSSRDRDRHSQNQPPQLEGNEPPFVDFDGRPTAQFKRQSSGSSKHSVGKNSDYSDSGRNRSRNNSRDFDTWDRKESTRDYNRSDSRNSYNSGSNRLPLEVHGMKPPTDRDRDRDRERKYRAGGGGGDSEEEFGVPFKYSAENSRDSSLRRSGGSGSGSCTRSRPGSGKTRGMSGKHSRGYPNSNRTDDDNEEEDEEDDDQSYNSYYSQSHSRRHHRVRYPNKYTQHHRSQQSLHSMGGGTGPRTNRKQNPLSPDRCYSNSNHESDEFDDSYDEDEQKSTAGVGGGVPGTMPGPGVPSRKQRDYNHEYDVDYEYGGKDYHLNRIKQQQQRRPGSGSSLASSGNKRYANISPLDERDRERERDRDRHNYRPERGPRGEMDSPREYYRSASGQGQRYHHRGEYRGRKYREEDSSKVNEDEDVMDEGGPKDQYSDYSCEDNPNMNSGRPHRDQRDRRYGNKGGRRSVGPLTTGGHRDRDQYDRPYRNCHTNSPSWDSESQSQSPDRDGANSNSNSGCERRKIRWESSEKNRDRRDPQFQQQQQHKSKSRGSHSGSRNSSQIQNPMGPLKAPGRLPVNTVTGITATTTLVATVATTDFHFEDDFSFATGNKDKELTEIVPNSSTSVSLSEVLGSGTCHIPPQSPFEDNFVVPVTISEGQGHAVLTSDKLRQDSPDGFDSIEFKRGCEEDNFSLGLGLTLTNLISGDIFFPAKFDVDLEVEKESRRFNNAVATASIIDATTASTSMTPTPTYTPSSADLTRSSPSMSAMLISNVSSTTKRLESIRSEEERQESSEDGGDNLSDKEIPIEIQNVNEKESVDLNPHSTEQDLEISVARPEPVPELESLSDTTTVTVSDAAATTNDLKIDIKSELITNHDIICNTINENKNEEDDLSDDEPNMTAPTDARPPPPTTATPNNTVNNLNNLSNNNRNANGVEDNSVNNTTNMKKSESFNIFDRDKDPFADDDFFS